MDCELSGESANGTDAGNDIVIIPRVGIGPTYVNIVLTFKMHMDILR